MQSYPIQGIEVPAVMYGTAWKEERTAALVRLALEAGFRAIDSANQRKHYVEAAVGEALEGGVARGELFLQTKFTYARGQDHRLPYDPSADVATQVRQSCASSLVHLRTSWLDGYLLHGPWGGRGLTREDRAVWRTFEALHEAGTVRLLGISNVSLEQLETLWSEAEVKPALVQNRCYARDGWDREVRAFCRRQGILYQGFSLLTANQRELASPIVQRIARRVARSVPEVVFAFARALGIVALTGTSDPAHMRLDLAAGDITLTPAEVDDLEHVGARR